MQMLKRLRMTYLDKLLTAFIAGAFFGFAFNQAYEMYLIAQAGF